VQRYHDLNTPMIAIVGFLGALVTFIVIVAMQVLYFNVANRQDERKIINVATTESDSLVLEQEAKLTRYGWINREKKQAAVPIERAMDLVVRELSAAQDKGAER
jgi:hypothetical protein